MRRLLWYLTNSVRVGEKFLEWVDDPLTPEHILESITLYWLTDTIARSIYTYRQVRICRYYHVNQVADA
jgi:hypothetical protein